MNHWSHLLGQVKPPEPTKNGRVHVIADDIDPVTRMPASRSGRKGKPIPVFTPEDIRALARALHKPEPILTAAGEAAVKRLG